LNDYLIPIEKLGIPVKICVGNHDINRVRNPNLTILKYIRDRYNATYSWLDYNNSSCYKFEHNGVLFMCLGLYPKNLEWLKKNLPKDATKPIIFFYHYSTDPEFALSDWW